MKGLFMTTVPAVVLSLATGPLAAAVPSPESVPGGVAVIALDLKQRPADVRYRDNRVLLTNDDGRWKAVVGIPLDANTGGHEIVIERRDGARERIPFQVHSYDYATQHITIADERMVHPDEEALKRIRRETPIIRRALSTWTEAEEVPLRFSLPVHGRQTSAFGLRRFINEQPRNPHRGLDIAGGTGTPISAPAEGVVIETGDYYFNGKTVFVDHGQGLVSMFCHMSRIDVEPGQIIARGDKLGEVGATGRVTGPHLHWSVSLNGTMVNPRMFLVDQRPLDEER
jgi:hypothetical protein